MKIQNAKVTITLDNPNEILEAMGSKEKMEFFESLSCHDEIIEYVMQQVFEGYTQDNFCHGSVVCDWNGNAPLQVFRKKLIECTADYTTKERIKDLERTLQSKEEQIQTLLEENHELFGGH